MASGPARAALPCDRHDDRHLQACHLPEVESDRLRLSPFLRVDSRISAGGVDEGQDGTGEFLRQLHDPNCLPVPLRFRHAEVAMQLLFRISSLLLSEDADRLIVEQGKSCDHRRIVSKIPVTMPFFELGEDKIDIVEKIGTLGVSRQLNLLEGGHLLENVLP